MDSIWCEALGIAIVAIIITYLIIKFDRDEI